MDLITIAEAKRDAAKLYTEAAWSAGLDGERATPEARAAYFNRAADYMRRAADLWLEAGDHPADGRASDRREAEYLRMLADAWTAAAMRGAA